jgi:hypothetical protein
MFIVLLNKIFWHVVHSNKHTIDANQFTNKTALHTMYKLNFRFGDSNRWSSVLGSETLFIQYQNVVNCLPLNFNSKQLRCLIFWHFFSCFWCPLVRSYSLRLIMLFEWIIFLAVMRKSAQLSEKGSSKLFRIVDYLESNERFQYLHMSM